MPGYRTIAKFRKENWAALKATNRSFVLLLRELDLVGGEVVAIDGAFFHGDASKASIKTQRKLAKRLTEIEHGDLKPMAPRSRPTTAPRQNVRLRGRMAAGDGGGESAQKVAALMARRASSQADLARLEESGQTQLSRTDRRCPAVVEERPDGGGLQRPDRGRRQAQADRRERGRQRRQRYRPALRDGQGRKGRRSASRRCRRSPIPATTTARRCKACEEDGIVAYVPQAEANRAARSSKVASATKRFRYEAEANVYRCPAGAQLRPTKGCKTNGRPDRDPVCQPQVRLRGLRVPLALPLRQDADATVYRWEHEDVLDRHRARMKDADAQMRRRAELVEHPFGTLKCRAGYRHFLVRGFDKVRGEWSLMALCYNFSRVLSILGFDNFMAYLANRNPYWVLLLLKTVSAIITRLKAGVPHFQAKVRPTFACA